MTPVFGFTDRPTSVLVSIFLSLALAFQFICCRSETSDVSPTPNSSVVQRSCYTECEVVTVYYQWCSDRYVGGEYMETQCDDDVWSYNSGHTCREVCIGGGGQGGTGGGGHGSGGIGSNGTGTNGSVVVIGDFRFWKTPDGILHVNIEPIDWYRSTKSQRVEQIMLVLNAIYLYFCEEMEYEPIDWRDYFTTLSGGYGQTTIFNDQPEPCNVGFSISFGASSPYNFNMDTSPCQSGISSVFGGAYNWVWCRAGTNIIMLELAVENSCNTMFEDYVIQPDCP